MENNHSIIESILTDLVKGNAYYPITPASKEDINLFVAQANHLGVDSIVIEQLVSLYKVADSFTYEIIIQFHSCNGSIIFEWWDNHELWLGQRDFYTLRWADGKYCLGDASNSSFSEEYEFDTLIELIKGCIKEINDADYFNNENSNEAN